MLLYNHVYHLSHLTVRLVCEQRPVSYITLSVSCNASMEVEVIACSYDMDTAETCEYRQSLRVQQQLIFLQDVYSR